MLKATRLVVKWFWRIIAFLVIVTAVLVAVGRELAPQLAHYRGEMETYMSQLLGVSVDIGTVQAEWDGLSPLLRLRGVTFSNDSGESILAVGTAVAEVSLLRSLLNWQLVSKNLELVQVDMGFRQHDDRSWSLIGLPKTTAATENFDIDDPLDIFLTGRHIELRNAHFRFEFRTGHITEVELPSLLMENSGGFHRLTSNIRIDQQDESLALVIEGRGDPRNLDQFRASGYIRLNGFELDKALATLPGQLWEGLPNQEWRKGHELDFESWFDIRTGMDIRAHGRFDVGELPVDLQQELPFPERTGANFAARWQATGAWSLTLRNLLLEWGNVRSPNMDMVLSSANLGEPVTVRVPELDIAPWLQTLREVGFVRGVAARELDKLQPRGRLQSLEFTIKSADLADVQLAANLRNVAVESVRGAPALRRVNGYVKTTPFSGYADLTLGEGFSMYFPTVYDRPLGFQSGRGRVHWNLDMEQRQVDVHSGPLTVISDAGTAHGYFSLSVPFEFGSRPEELTIQVGVRNTQLKYYDRYIPTIVSKHLRTWLDQSLGEGTVTSGGFIYRGGLTFEALDRTSMQLYLDVAGADLNYHPDWPALSEAYGQVWFDDEEVTATISRAKLLDSWVTGGRVRVVPDRDQGFTLRVKGQLRGTAGDGLEFLENSPFRAGVNKQLAGLEISGDLRAELDLSMPITLRDLSEFTREEPEQTPFSLAPGGGADDGSDYKVGVTLRDVDLSLTELGLNVSDINGDLYYSRAKGLTSDIVTGRFWGYPLTAFLENTTTSAGAPALRLQMKGRSSVESLRDWRQLPALSFFQGETDFDVGIIIPYRDGNLNPAHLTLSSSLQGVSFDLPAPFNKTADEIRPLQVRVPIARPSTPYSVKYGDLLEAQLTLRGGTLNSLAVGLGGHEPPVEEGAFVVRGRLEEFAFNPWRETYKRFQKLSAGEGSTTGGLEPSNFTPAADVTFGRFRFDDVVVDELSMRANKNPQAWELILDSETLAGNFQIYDDELRPIAVTLNHLHWRDDAEQPPRTPLDVFLPNPPEAKQDPLSDWDPRALPAMDFAVNDFTYNGEEFGRWSFQLRPTDKGVKLSSLIASVRDGQIVGKGDQTGATLWWEMDQGEMHTRFDGRFTTGQLGSVLAQWGQPELVDSESAYFDSNIDWPGSPAAISTLNIEGDVSLVVENGSFYQDEAQPGAGDALLQLISFFNFDTWVRRLRLDFSDLTRRGMSFDQIIGTLEFAQGTVYLNRPLVVQTPSGKFQITGIVDLIHENVDARLIATLPVGGNLTLFTALAAGLPAALGVYVVSKVFEEQMSKVASLRYRVTGDLNDPQFEFERLFDDEMPVPELGSAGENKN